MPLGSLIYDYSGEEEYNAFYLMADANIGEKLNIVTGLRNEKNKTTYQSYHGMRTMVSAWSTAGSDTISYHTRRNSFMLPSLFIKILRIGYHCVMSKQIRSRGQIILQ